MSEGNVYKSPIFIKSQETTSVPVLNDVHYNAESMKKSTNGHYCHEDLIFPAIKEPNQTIMQDVTNVLKYETIEEKPIINGISKLDISIDKIPHKTKNNEIKTTEEIYKDKDNFNKFNFPLCANGRKARTRSVESAICDIELKRQRKGVKRSRSVEMIPQSPSKLPKLDIKERTTEKQTVQVPSPKQENKFKEHRSKDKREHRSSRDKKRRCSVGIQARPSQDSGRHYLKLLEPRPCLLEGGNLSYPPSDVSVTILLYFLYSNKHQKLTSNKIVYIEFKI